MKRREFITALASTATWPLAAHAQQASPARRIGVFLGLAASADDPGAGEIVRPFKAAMQEAGWIDGRNIRLDYRFGGGDLVKINAAAAELVALAPELIYATGLPPAQALRQKTRTIPSFLTCRRSGWLRVGRAPQPAGRECHGVYRLGPLYRRKMDAAAPGDRSQS